MSGECLHGRFDARVCSLQDNSVSDVRAIGNNVNALTNAEHITLQERDRQE